MVAMHNLHKIIIYNMYIHIGRGYPSLKHLYNHVVEDVAVKWRDVGIQLLNTSSAINTLDIIEANHKQVSSYTHIAVGHNYACTYHQGCQEGGGQRGHSALGPRV